MIRLSILTISILALTASCAGPVQTRIQTQMASPFPGQNQFSFTHKPEQQSAAYQTARTLVAQELGNRSLTQDDAAPMLVHIAFADRPASMAITAGEADEQAPVVIPKNRELLQSCDDSEHWLSISIVNRTDGNPIYNGSASEYHCKGKFDDSLPHLVRAALSGFEATPDGAVHTQTLTRSGIE